MTLCTIQKKSKSLFHCCMFTLKHPFYHFSIPMMLCEEHQKMVGLRIWHKDVLGRSATYLILCRGSTKFFFLYSLHRILYACCEKPKKGMCGYYQIKVQVLSNKHYIITYHYGIRLKKKITTRPKSRLSQSNTTTPLLRILPNLSTTFNQLSQLDRGMFLLPLGGTAEFSPLISRMSQRRTVPLISRTLAQVIIISAFSATVI